MYKLILFKIDAFDEELMGGACYENSKLYAYDHILRHWLWNGKVVRWFRDTLGYGPYFKVWIDYPTRALESHGWRTSDPELFKLMFPEALPWKVVEMTPLEKAINAYDRLLSAGEGAGCDAIYHELITILATFDLAPGAFASGVNIVSPVTIQKLENRPPAVQMASIIADLAGKGINPPALSDEADYKLRLVHGLLNLRRNALGD